MTQQQQQQAPNILQPEVQKAWDVWADARIHDQVQPFLNDIVKALNENVDDTNAALDNLVDEVAKVTGPHAKKIFELQEIVQVLAIGNDFLGGRIDQITREFKGLARKQAPKTIERTIATTTEEERTSRVSQTLSIIDEVLNG